MKYNLKQIIGTSNGQISLLCKFVVSKDKQITDTKSLNLSCASSYPLSLSRGSRKHQKDLMRREIRFDHLYFFYENALLVKGKMKVVR